MAVIVMVVVVIEVVKQFIEANIATIVVIIKASHKHSSCLGSRAIRRSNN